MPSAALARSGSCLRPKAAKAYMRPLLTFMLSCSMAVAGILAKSGFGARPLSPRLRHHAAAFQCDHHDLLFFSAAMFSSMARLR